MPSKLVVIVLAAGKGVRMKSAKPKVLHNFLGRPMVLRALDAILSLGPQEVRVVVGNGRDQVESEVKAWAEAARFSAVSCVIQEQQLGTGDAVKAGLSGMTIGDDSSVLIIPGDTPLLSAPILKSFIETSVLSPEAPVSVLTADVPQPTGFGRIIRNDSGQVVSIVEEKDCSDPQRKITEINSSVFFVNARFLATAVSSLKSDNAQKEYYLTDIASFAVGQKKLVNAFKTENYLNIMGVNNRLELAKLEVLARKEINERHLLNGVTLEDPNNCYLGEAVTIGEESFVGAGTKISGKTIIGKNVVIEGNCFITDSTIADGVLVRFGCYFNGAVVGAGTKVGPFAHLRPGAELSEEVHIGNFVEVKKSKFGKGAKANHLAYIGDAEVGEGSNIGAGTIFCNYDGKNKHRSSVGKKSFVGSNSTLVSPVIIGDDAYVAAGSVITDDVPSEALALGRARQVVKPGYSKKK